MSTGRGSGRHLDRGARRTNDRAPECRGERAQGMEGAGFGGVVAGAQQESSW